MQTVVSFPGKGSAEIHTAEFDGWLSWAHCELSILGYEPDEVDFDWRAAFARGLEPHVAAAEAVVDLKTD